VSWSGAKSMMADPYFLKSLVEFDKDGLSDKQVKRVKGDYIKDPAFTLDNIKNVSTAGAGERRACGCFGSRRDVCWGRTSKYSAT